MKQYHNFVDRNLVLFRAVTFCESDGGLTSEDLERLDEFGLRRCCLEGVPDWLKKWASLICEYILFEQSKYPDLFRADFPTLSEEMLQLDAKNVRDVKLQNVAITIDKVLHVLKSMGSTEPPLKVVKKQELF